MLHVLLHLSQATTDSDHAAACNVMASLHAWEADRETIRDCFPMELQLTKPDLI